MNFTYGALDEPCQLRALEVPPSKPLDNDHVGDSRFLASGSPSLTICCGFRVLGLGVCGSRG